MNIFKKYDNFHKSELPASLDLKKYRYAFGFPIKKGPANNAGPQ